MNKQTQPKKHSSASTIKSFLRTAANLTSSVPNWGMLHSITTIWVEWTTSSLMNKNFRTNKCLQIVNGEALCKTTLLLSIFSNQLHKHTIISQRNKQAWGLPKPNTNLKPIRLRYHRITALSIISWILTNSLDSSPFKAQSFVSGSSRSKLTEENPRL